MNIEFFWNSGIVGRTHFMDIEGKKISLGRITSSEEEAKEKAIFILKEHYGIDFDTNKIVFKWGGRL